MYEQGEDISSPSADTYLAPYTVPYVGPDEDLSTETIYLSLVGKNVSSNLTCDEQLNFEELALKWLYVSRRFEIIYLLC